MYMSDCTTYDLSRLTTAKVCEREQLETAQSSTHTLNIGVKRNIFLRYHLQPEDSMDILALGLSFKQPNIYLAPALVVQLHRRGRRSRHPSSAGAPYQPLAEQYPGFPYLP